MGFNSFQTGEVHTAGIKKAGPESAGQSQIPETLPRSLFSKFDWTGLRSHHKFKNQYLIVIIGIPGCANS